MTIYDWSERQHGFPHPASLEEVERMLDQRLAPLSSERIELPTACGRVLAHNVASPFAIPLFDRAAMDGFAIRSADIAGASAASPTELILVGEALPNRPYQGVVVGGQAVAITTGAPLPAESDAVVRQEDVRIASMTVAIEQPIAAGRNVSRRSEDLAEGEAILSAGRVLRPQDLGLLASVGMATPAVIRKPRVSLLVTGNEVLPLGAKPSGFQVVDSSSVMLSALIGRDGGVAERPTYLPDDPAAIGRALVASAADVVIVTGGTSIGVEDFGPRVVQELGELLVHGMHIRPARPIGIGFVQRRVVFLLPGNPLSCLCAYDLVVRLAIQRLGGRAWRLPYHRVHLAAGATIPGEPGRWDYVRVLVRNDQVLPLRRGGGSGASILSSATRSDGFVLLPPSHGGVPKGSFLDVHIYEA